MAGPFTNFLIGQGKGLTRAERRRLANRTASGEFIPKGNLPTEFNGQVNPNVRQPIDGELVPPPSGYLTPPQGQIGADGVMITPPPAKQGLLGAPAPSTPLQLPAPTDINPKTGRPYGKLGVAALAAAGGVGLMSMGGNEGNPAANLTPEQIQEDKDGRDQMIKDAEDIKSGAATPDQLLRATNFQRMEAAASGRPIEKIDKPEGLDQGFWDTLSGKFDMTSVGLSLMASSANGQPFGANLGRALQVGLMSADSKKALSKADQAKADAEAKRDKIRTDALALADTKYADSLAQQEKVNKREDEKVQITKTKAVLNEISANNARNLSIAKARGANNKTPTTNERREVAAIAENTESLGFTLDLKTSEGFQIANHAIYAARAALPIGATAKEKKNEYIKQLSLHYERNKTFYFDNVTVDPRKSQAANGQPLPTSGSVINIDGVDIQVN